MSVTHADSDIFIVTRLDIGIMTVVHADSDIFIVTQLDTGIMSLLGSITGTQKISVPMTIVVSGIAKLFVGEVVETARIVMKERKESGPIRPCHLREAYRRLKLEGKVFKRSASRLFR
ncbi:hypothetical protein Fmac_028391 [Flemingia macrophylla]|uniref:TAFII28-like protein domain-containing protein n=1 Tax=Flemingia macrophylla TaxID=520843 RepID=A0ABD1L7C7_9FABA